MSTLDKQIIRVISTLCIDVGSPVSKQVLKHLATEDWLGLVSMTIDPGDYENPYNFKWDYACVEILRKCPIEIPGVDREKRARESFFSSEHSCHKTNIRLDPLINNHFLGESARLIKFIDDARGWIKRVLGEVPRNLNGRFGPGATYSDKGSLTTIPDKMSNRPTTTSDCRLLQPLFDEYAWSRALTVGNRESDLLTVRGNRFTTVPKDALKVRGICIEPSINLFWQLAVGKLMKSRLSGFGIDLKYGQQKHRLWAQQGSRLGNLATIDLSNASDTVSTNLVKLLLPDLWFELLLTLRSPFTRIDGKWVKLEKFSSMGNGFTFELETLIFSAICFACGCGEPGSDFLVYGDDIIVPTKNGSDVVSALKYFGFQTNSRKTFLNGPFRESCGGDFFLGHAVRPHYLKDIPDEPHQWISLANGLRRLVFEDRFDDFRFSNPFRAWLRVLDCLPSHIRRIRGPKHLGDLVIHDQEFERKWKNGIAYIRVWKPLSKKLPWCHWSSEVVMASALYGCRQEGVTPRSAVSGYKVGFLTYS